MGRSYKELLSIVEEVEKEAVKVDSANVDVSELQNAKIINLKPDFKYLLNIAMSMEVGHNISTRPQMQNKEPHEKKGKGEPGEKKITPASLIEQTAIMEGNKQTEGVKGEISAFASSLTERSQPVARLMSTLNMKLEGADDVLLPKLSTSDQVAELERIIEGLKGNSFDKASLDVVKKELYGLKKSITAEKKSKTKESGTIEQSMVVLRDEHLERALAMLNDKLGGVK